MSQGIGLQPSAGTSLSHGGRAPTSLNRTAAVNDESYRLLLYSGVNERRVEPISRSPDESGS
jgi:hypothetical protein